MAKSKVICGDCRDVIPKIPFKFEFIFADPPFNIGHGYTGYDDNKSIDEFAVFMTDWLTAAWDALAPNGVLALHGPDLIAEAYLIWARAFGYHRVAWVNWHYRFGQCSRANWIDGRCHCLIYAKNPENYTWNPESVLVQSDRVAYGDKRVGDSPNGGKRLPSTVWGVPSDGQYWGRVSGNSTERRGMHPNQLPEVYLERLIKAYTNPGDRILDPFCGSGTTATVAVALDRRVVTIDISKENCDAATERIKRGPVRVRG